MSRCLVCKKLKELHKLVSCINCGDAGPYCKDCDECKACNQPVPGNWTCGAGGKHTMTKDCFKAKCVDDYEGYWQCGDCLTQCRCGQGETHYLCRGDRKGGGCYESHKCEWRNKADNERCNMVVCRTYGGIKEISGETVLFCPKHRPSVSNSLRDAVVRHIKENESAEYKKRLREELE